MSEGEKAPLLRRATELVEQGFQDIVIPLYYRTDMARSLDRGKPLPYLQVVTTLVKEYGLKTIVEIGSMRRPMNHALDEFKAECCNEGHSTLFFAATGAEVSNLHVYTADGIWFLNRFEREIDLLYLDAWDVLAGTNYAEKHLEAYRAALPHLARTCVVLIDDTDILNGGKGRLVIPQMIRDGFELITWGRQALLVRG